MDEVNRSGATGIQQIEDCLIAHVDNGSDEDGLIRLKKSILDHMTRTRFRGVIINVSGVSILGSYGAAILMETSRAVEVMGAQMVFVGFRPGVAAALVEFDVDTSGIRTAVTAADAFDLIKSPKAKDKPCLHGEKGANGPFF